ncbi:MAG: sigma-70 family RNA polymerase sigma factor [Nannocystaceae bacterium]
MLYRQQYGFVWRVLRSLGVPAASTDDACQDVFMVVHRRIQDFDGRGAIRSWLYGIARNVAKRSATKHALRNSRERGSDPGNEALGATHERPEDYDRRIDANEFVARFLATLKPSQRAVFVAAEIEGMTAPEIRDAMGGSLDTVYSRLRLARRHFATARQRYHAREQGTERRHG